MKFISIVEQKFKELNEQVPGELPPAQPVDLSLPAAAPAPPPAPEPPPPEQKPLTPEGEVFLVRLLRKALFMNPGDVDEKTLKDLPEVNETNASDVLTSIVDIMKKYSNSIDVITDKETNK